MAYEPQRALAPVPGGLQSVGTEPDDLVDATRLFENAEKIAPRITIGEPILNYLYENSRWQRLPRADWEREVRIACATDHIVFNFFPGLKLGGLAALVDQATMTNASRSVASSKGTLFLTFHGAHVLVAKKIFASAFERGLLLARHGTILGAGAAKKDQRDALFALLRALEDGRNLFFAADGRNGRQTATLNVLGTATAAGEGAAFLAHASGCNTAWYTVVREDNRFVPIVEAGPTKAKGESLKNFSDRLYRFYSERIEAMFTGDPRNIVFRPRWGRVLNAKARGLAVPGAFAPAR